MRSSQENDDTSDKLDTYLKENQSVKVQFFENDKDLIISFFNKLKESDPAAICGWNSSGFDIPYLYHRLLYFYGSPEEVSKIISRFDIVEERFVSDRMGKKSPKIIIPEYLDMDLMNLYKPRADGGQNLGTKLQSYKLNFVANYELGMQKLEYKSEGLTLDTFYQQNPMDFALYNLYDVALCVKLESKMGMCELFNMLRRKMRTSLNSALSGSSRLFDNNITATMNNDKIFVRYNSAKESTFGVNSNEVKQIGVKNTKKKLKWDVEFIDDKEAIKCISRYPGAYVKNPIPGLYTGIISDLDATSLYPSVINQYNIGLDTFQGRIISRFVCKQFDVLDKLLGKKLPPSVFDTFKTKIMDLVEDRVEGLEDDDNETDNFSNKNKIKQQFYYILSFLYKKLIESGFTLQELLDPQNLKQYIVTRKYLNNLLNALEVIHINQKEYNQIAYDYIVNKKDLGGETLYLIENYNDPNFRIIKLPGDQLPEYLSKNNFGLTLSGTIFKIHEKHLSLFYIFLKDLYKLRKHYKNEMYKHPADSFEFAEFNRRQLTTKVLMNSTYGLLGMSGFRFSNVWLARTITISGRLALKTAQYYAENYLKLLKKEFEGLQDEELKNEINKFLNN